MRSALAISFMQRDPLSITNLHKTLFNTIIATVTPIISLHVEIALRRADAWDCGSQCAAQRDDDAKAVGDFEVE